ncbi:AP-3 complex subunit delta-1 [Fopius arisanus]|uniref:AP-3 complex subunit delta n=1 Tax=Fopius arisanus TaxID=64838 RepID=A0A9R1UBE3_9HYME|nr:PREDICTED: AP-3 complex subunit delta-1 [Fopius arisanus]XP_011315344.1 PREDICTED: AP-3 complex subunit delta-1 [Fopius arisanus]
MALRKVKGNFERMFDKNLTDLVRGIRNNKNNEAKYIAQCIEEIKQELRQDNIAVKANAVAKLMYLQMLGYDISWAGFNIIEVMSSGKFTYKRIGYLAGSQSFHMDTELLMLTTNMIRKDLNSQNQYDAGLALSGLSCFISPDLAKDLVNDIMTLLTSTKPYLRKKAVLMMYKVFLRFPEALRPAFPRLKEKLEDPDSGVQSAAVNVVCELARKNPKNYLSLAPIFFKLMTTSTNNWMLIKIIKLFGALTPLEPRLGKKLIEPLTNLIHSTSAMSLLYECINTVIAVLISISSGMPNHSDSIQLCVQKLRILIEDSDQNLKYLGLLAMSKILKTHPKSVQAHKDLIMQCLDDKDESIRLRALDLLYGMVSKKNLMEIVRKLMIHMDKAEGTTYRDELLSKIIQICSQNNYQFITYFEWYISVLVDLTKMEGTKHGQLVATQLLDVAIRVQAIRKCAVQQCALLLDNAHLLTGTPRATMCEVLYAAAWICGEFSSELDDPIATLKSMLKSQASSLPGHIQAVYVHNILKLAAMTLNKAQEENDRETMEEIFALKDGMNEFICSGDLEVQERATAVLVLFDYLKENPSLIKELADTFQGELNPVAPKAQRKVPIPEGLDLDSWINDPPSESSDDEDLDMNDIFVKSEKNSEYGEKKTVELTSEELQRRRDLRKIEQENNPHYLKGHSSPKNYHYNNDKSDDYDHIPIAKLDIPVSLKINSLSSKFSVDDKRLKSDKKKDKTKKKHHSKKGKRDLKESSDEEQDNDYPAHFVNTGIGELPPGAELSDNDDNNISDVNDPHRALNIDLDIPLREDERLPVLEHRPGPRDSKNNPEKSERKGKSSKKIKKKTKEEKRERSNSENQNNIDLWLGNDIAIHNKENEITSDSLNVENKDNDVDDGDEGEKKKESKKKGGKAKKKKRKEEEGKRKKKKSESKQNTSGYEETAGISTPSKEIVPGLSVNFHESNEETLNNLYQMPSGHQELAKNDKMKMMFELKQLPHENGKLIVSIFLVNCGDKVIKDLDLDVTDSSTLKLVRNLNEESGIKIRVKLAPQATTEVHLPILIVDDTFAQKLRGSLSYFVDNSSAMIQEKLDFVLKFSCCDFITGNLPHGDILTELLGSDMLQFKTKNNVDISLNLGQIVEMVCQRCNLTLVEQVDDAASLYGNSLMGHHVCLLFKKKSSDASSSLSIEGKGDNNSLLSGIIEEIVNTITK